MQETWDTIREWLTSPEARSYFKAALILVSGFLVARLVKRRLGFSRLHAQARMILRRVVGYLIITVTLIWALRELGFQLSALLGAAGLLTVALGFAAKTSVSNLISGLFLIGERPFVVGDVIKIGETTGEVLSVDLMSTKLRTFDNLLVRIPNETLLSREVTNLSHFPIRRYDLKISVAYRSDLKQVKKLLDGVADGNPLCLVDPKPVFIFLGYGASGIDLQFSVWSKREKFLELKTSISREVKDAFDQAGVEIPFPHQSVYTGAATEPFPIRLVTEPAATPAPGDPGTGGEPV